MTLPRGRLLELYEKHDPTKRDFVDTLIATYKGGSLASLLQARPRPSGTHPPSPPARPSPPSLPARCLGTCSKRAWRSLGGGNEDEAAHH